MKIAVSADSTTSISQKEAKELGVFILPLNVIVDGEEYHDDINIDQDKLKTMMRGGSKINTSTPTPYEIENYFDNIFKQGYDKVIHYTISSKLSSMYELFVVTCKEKYGDKVIVIDSLSVCSFMGNMIKRTKKMVDEKKTLEEILPIISENQNTDDVYFIPESLTFLKNGGRVSPAVAMVGNLIGIKPILRFINGSIDKYSTTRNVRKGLLELFEMIKSKDYDPKLYEIHVLYFDAEKIFDKVLEVVKQHFSEYDILATPVSINVCAHAGPGTVGIGVSRK